MGKTRTRVPVIRFSAFCSLVYIHFSMLSGVFEGDLLIVGVGALETPMGFWDTSRRYSW